MEENKTIFNYIGQFFATYGSIVSVFIIFGSSIGNLAKGHSSLFSMGNEGFSIGTLLELLLFAAIITVVQIVFLTDKWIKNMRLIIRNICFFGIIIVVMVVFSIVFVWFPINEVRAWGGFIISFLICTIISITISKLEEKAENRKMEQALNRFQKDKQTPNEGEEHK